MLDTDKTHYVQETKEQNFYTIIAMFMILIVLFLTGIFLLKEYKQPTEKVTQHCIKNTFDTISQNINYYKKLSSNLDTCTTPNSLLDIITKTDKYNDSLRKPYVLITSYKNNFISDFGTLDELLKIKKSRYDEMVKKSKIIDSTENSEKLKLKELNSPIK